MPMEVLSLSMTSVLPMAPAAKQRFVLNLFVSYLDSQFISLF